MSWTSRDVRKQMRWSRMRGTGSLIPISCATRTSPPNLDSGGHRIRARLHLPLLGSRPKIAGPLDPQASHNRRNDGASGDQQDHSAAVKQECAAHPGRSRHRGGRRLRGTPSSTAPTLLPE